MIKFNRTLEESMCTNHIEDLGLMLYIWGKIKLGTEGWDRVGSGESRGIHKGKRFDFDIDNKRLLLYVVEIMGERTYINEDHWQGCGEEGTG